VIWTADWNQAQGRLVASMYQQAQDVPSERHAVVAGGLPGADKAEVLQAAGVDHSLYFIVSIDRILRQMAADDLVPLVEGLSPMEAAHLVHAEAQFLAKRVGLRAMADGRNLIWDISMASLHATQALVDALQLAGYSVRAVFADLPVEESVRRADAAHRHGHDEYRAGRGMGGRYIPAGAIRALAFLPGERASAFAPTPLPEAIKAAQCPEFPGGEVTAMIDAYCAGKIDLEDLARQFRRRRWPVVPPACPAGLEHAAPAIDDPEPYVPGSFDDVVLAYDLGKLSDHDYRVLAMAASGACANHPLSVSGDWHTCRQSGCQRS
jgi:hypothetical protein